MCLQENTSAVVGVKAELGAPDPTQPKAGRIEFFVDWYAKESEPFLIITWCLSEIERRDPCLFFFQRLKFLCSQIT